jgi:hypothetical protein
VCGKTLFSGVSYRVRTVIKKIYRLPFRRRKLMGKLKV